MNKLAKGLVSLLTAAVLLLGAGVAARAEGEEDIRVQVDGYDLSFLRGEETIKSYKLGDTDIKLITDEEDDLLVCFSDSEDIYRGYSLGGQQAVRIGGKMHELTLSGTLDKGIAIRLDATADILYVKSFCKNNITIEGEVGELIAHGPTKIKVEGDGTIDLAKLPSKSASIVAASGTEVGEVRSAVRAQATGKGIGRVLITVFDDEDEDNEDEDEYGTRRGEYGYMGDDEDDHRGRGDKEPKLYGTSGRIYADGSGHELRDYTSKLNRTVVAKYDGKRVYGRCEWVSPNAAIPDGVSSHQFKFIPDDRDKYEITYGYLDVEVSNSLV